jgi:hypothetical protein
MISRLLSNQIPEFWEVIKFGAVRADGIIKEDVPLFANALLENLLSDKNQCFLKRSDVDKSPETLLVTSVDFNKVSGIKTVNILYLYSYTKALEDDWKLFAKLVLDYAALQNCQFIQFSSNNPMVWKLGESYGFQELYRTYSLKVGG